MLRTFKETSEIIESGKACHISGTESLLRKLPKGNWVGGSTEYFMAEGGGIVTDQLLYVTLLPYDNINIKQYDKSAVKNVAKDAYENGFTILIIPFDSAVHIEYAENAAAYDDMFMKNIVGWISGMNLGKSDQAPISANGKTGEVYKDIAVAMHVEAPGDKTVSLNMINIFEQDADSPTITFSDEGFSVEKCFIDGKETYLADYLNDNKIDIKLPLVGDYSGNGVNISFKAIEGKKVNFYAPVFNGIEYKMARLTGDYVDNFQNRIEQIDSDKPAFVCNCILNFLYGGLEGKVIKSFCGPITFGEIAYQLVNQTLVYVTVA